jgi:hemerythrin-like metal-binding protein
MQSTNYPQFEAHRVEHKKLLNDVLLFKSRYIAGDLVAADVSTFLVEWMVKHIKESDRDYGAHLNAHGVY